MSFGGAFGSTAFGGAAKSGESSSNLGPELQEIQSSELEFSGFNGEAKIQLLPKPWPESQLPPPTSSLLSVASKPGILAAAGPESVVIAKLDAVRDAFNKKDVSSNIKPFEPQLVLPVGIRVSQVAFSSDGSCLAISAEQGGGIAAYETQGLLQGNTNSAFELPSEGQALRALAPNPATDSAELFAAVTAKGQLMIADMKTRSWRPGKSGAVFQENVSSVAWSPKGKALLVGLGNGAVVQLKPDGTTMSEIPRPQNLEDGKFVSAISWLENDLGIFVYTPSASDGMAEPSDYYVWERTGGKGSPVVHNFSKLPEVASGFGDRTPAAQFMAKLRNFHNCDHIIIVSTTPSEDVGIISKSKVPLGEGAPANVFTSTTQVNDSRRAQLPMTADMSNSTTPIGMALDLTATKNVIRPIPGDEYDESPGPLPGLMILNNEGVLAAWWLVYADAIRKGVSYSGLMVNEGSQSQTPTATQNTQAAVPAASPFGSAAASSQKAPAFGQTSMAAAAAAAKPAFGQTSFGSAAPTSSFGQVSKPAFGQTSGISSTFGANKPAFGSTSAIGSNGSSPFAALAGAQMSKPQSSAPAFGQAGSFGALSTSTAATSSQTSSPFASKPSGVFGGNSSTVSPFGQAASGTGTSAFGSGTKNAFSPPATSAASPFGKPSVPANPFAPTSSTASVGQSSPFGSGGAFGAGAKSPFAPNPTTQDKPTSSPFAPANPFSITSSFAEKATKSDDAEEKTSKSSGGGFFGTSFGSALNDAKQAAPNEDREEDMDDEEEPSKAPESPEITQSTTPKETPAAQKTLGVASIGAGSLFGNTPEAAKTPTVDERRPTPTFSFTQDTPRAASPKIIPTTVEKNYGETPLPPESTSKDTFTPTNSSAASSIDALQGSAEAAPLPPDFVKPKPKAAETIEEAPPLPPDFTKSKPSAGTDDVPPLPPDFTKPAPEKAPTSAPSVSAKEDQTSTTAPLPPDFLPSKAKTEVEKEEKPPSLPIEDTSPLDDEGSGIDVANELSTDASPESSFGSNVFVSKPVSKSAQPIQSAKSVFASVPKANVPFFSMPPPSKEPDSPRSPSPVRHGRGMAELKPPSMSMRSVSGPANPRAGQGTRKVTQGRMQPPPQKFAQPVTSFASNEKAAEEERLLIEKKRQAQQAAEEQELSDQEDEYIRAELEAPVKPTTRLSNFLAHTDYTGGVSKAGVPGQIEVVYRDANSMVDTLGLNARSVAAWVAGHSVPNEKAKGQVSRGVEDLEDPDDWTLVEMQEVLNVESKVQRELDDGTIKQGQSQVLVKLMNDMTIELSRLRRRNEEIARTVDNLQKSSEVEDDIDDMSDVAPLSAVAAESQHDLRRSLANFRSNLAAAEEGVALMRAKLASLNKRTDGAAAAGQVPTVEAVERTISKMIAMFERKSADLDVLTTQARQLGVLDETSVNKRPGSKAGLLKMSEHGQRSRSGSPFESPSSSRPASRYGTPMRGSTGPGQFTPSKSRLSSSLLLVEKLGGLNIGGAGTNGMQLSEEAAKEYAARLKVRKQVKVVLKEALGEGAPRVRTLDDD